MFNETNEGLGAAFEEGGGVISGSGLEIFLTGLAAAVPVFVIYKIFFEKH